MQTKNRHYGESATSRIDKMSNNTDEHKPYKKFFNKKRRQLLKQNHEDKI